MRFGRRIAGSFGTLTGLTILSSAALAVDTGGDFRVKGHGLESCASLVEAYGRQDGTALFYLTWLNGYLTAFNQLQPQTYDIAGDLTVNDLGSWLVNYCNENSDQNIVNAASTLVGALRDQRLTARPGGTAQGVEYDPGLVRNVQQALKEEGFYKSSVDGLFGSGTKEAIIAFQRARELPVTGLPDFATTLELLNE